MMVKKINGSRSFEDMTEEATLYRMHTRQRNKGKYNLLVKEKGVYTLCYDLCYNLLFFNTIKDVQRKVLSGTESIKTM